MTRSTPALLRHSALVLATACLLIAPFAAHGDGFTIRPPRAPASAGPFDPCVVNETPGATITAGTPGVFDNFGNAVAIDGDIAAVGAWLDDDSGISSGAASVYRYDGAQWNIEARLDLLPGVSLAPGDLFGWSVDVSGDRVAVGAYLDDDAASNAGAVYVFLYDSNTSTWGLEQKLTAFDASAEDRFGWDVAIDDTSLLVGAPKHDGGGDAAGATYFYFFSGPIWLSVGPPIMGSNAGDQSGFAVAVQTPWYAIGEPGFDNAGDNGGRVILGGPDNNTFIGLGGAQVGYSLAMHEDVLVIGVPGGEVVEVLNVEGGVWVAEQTLMADPWVPGDRFGASVDIRGEFILVGAPYRDSTVPDAGAAYLFADIGPDTAPWEQTGLLVLGELDMPPAATDLLGQSVALGENLALVGAPLRDVIVQNDGAVFQFDIPDCNDNGQPDSCDIEQGISDDRNSNAIPDECERIQAGLIVVDPASPNATSNGFTWTTAVHELRDALEMAANSGGAITEIWVAARDPHYVPTDDFDRTRSFNIPAGVAVYGGFLGNAYPGGGETMLDQRDPAANETILSGDLFGDDPTLGPPPPGSTDENSYHVVRINGVGNVILDGFTIEAGNADGTAPDDGGAGVFISNLAQGIQIINCRITDNTAAGPGGAMLSDQSEVILTDCTIEGNQAADGGGIYSISSSLTILGGSFTDNHAISAGMGTGGALCATFAGGVSVTGVTFTLNTADNDGGAVLTNVTDNATFTNCTFQMNEAIDGGAFYVTFFGSPTIQSCTFDQNVATGRGGGVHNSGGDPTITASTFTLNQAADGGGFATTGGSPTLINCEFGTAANPNDGNIATSLGGGIYSDIGTNPLTLVNCTIDENTAPDGGGMYMSKTDAVISGGTFSANVATGTGGGLCATSDGSLDVQNVTFNGNIAVGSGGGVLLNSTLLVSFTGCTFSLNTSPSLGGALYNQGGDPAFTDCMIVGNIASIGGGLYNIGGHPVLTDCTFAVNTATNGSEEGQGGGIFTISGNPQLTDCIFNANFADWYGGGIYNVGGGPVLTRCSFTDNIASNVTFLDGQGGGLFTLTGDPILIDCALTGNFADLSGGGMFLQTGNPAIVGSTFDGNQAGIRGGGVHIAGGAAALTRCTITGNDAGGIAVSGGMPRITSCLVRLNIAPRGGGIEVTSGGSPEIVNCLITGNLAAGTSPTIDGGAGVRISGSASVASIVNCTIVGNLNGPPPPGAPGPVGVPGAGVNLAGGSLNLDNSVLFSNAAEFVTTFDAQIAVGATGVLDATYNCIEAFPGAPPTGFGAGNIPGPPLFADQADLAGPDGFIGTADDGLSIIAGSPCIDAADSTILAVAIEFEDFTSYSSGDVADTETPGLRFVDDPQTTDTGIPGAVVPVVDMGAYEFAPTCLGDANGDGTVDITDLLGLLAAWSTNDPVYDIAPAGGDGTVDIQDLLVLLANWGACD